MQIIKFVKDKIQEILKVEKNPIVEKSICDLLNDWVISNYGNYLTVKEASTGSEYYTIKTGTKTIKLRISNHLEVFNGCDIYIQKIKNNSEYVIIREKKDRSACIYNYNEAIKYVKNYINAGTAKGAAKKAKLEAKKEAKNAKPILVSDYSQIKYPNVGSTHQFSTTDNISSNWKEFKNWYKIVNSIDINVLPGIYQNRFHNIFTCFYDYNKTQYIFLSCLKEHKDIYVAIDLVYQQFKNEKEAVKAAQEELKAKASKTEEVAKEPVKAVLPRKKTIPSTAGTQLTIIKPLVRLNWDQFMQEFQSTIANIGYDSMRDEEKDLIKKLFTTNFIKLTTIYEIFAIYYNTTKAHDPVIAAQQSIDAIGNPMDIYNAKELSGKTYLKYREVETSYKYNGFFIGLTELPSYWNDNGYRASHAKAWNGILGMMFPWVNDLAGNYLTTLAVISTKNATWIRIVEALLIAHERFNDASCSSILDFTLNILSMPEWRNISWDFSTGKSYVITAQVVINKPALEGNKVNDKVSDFPSPNDIVNDKPVFFTKLSDYYNLWDCYLYREKHFDRWIEIMNKMFPWINHEFVNSSPGLKYMAGLDNKGGLKRIIEVLLVTKDTYPHRSNANIVKEAVKLIDGDKDMLHRWDFKHNCVVHINPEENKKADVFVYHYDVPELIISKEDWLDIYEKRRENKKQLEECLNKDIKNFDRYTTKQKEIVVDLLNHDIPYEDCIVTINKYFNTTKTLQSGCNMLKKMYL